MAKKRSNRLTDTDIECIKSYADANMSAAEAGRKMFLHQNTVKSHLDSIKDKTGLNPRNFYDLIKLLEMV